MLLRIQSIISFICHSLFLLLLVRFFITLFAIYFVTYKFCCIFLYLTSKRKQNSRSISRMLWNMNQIIVWITIEIIYYWSVTVTVKHNTESQRRYASNRPLFEDWNKQGIASEIFAWDLLFREVLNLNGTEPTKGMQLYPSLYQTIVMNLMTQTTDTIR